MRPASFANASLKRIRCPSVTVEIGGIPILLEPSDPKFCDVLESRYETFATRNAATASGSTRFRLPLRNSSRSHAAAPPMKTRASRATARSGIFAAAISTPRGIRAPATAASPSARIPIRSTPSCASRIRSCSPSKAAFLLHAASAIRNNRAFLFAGVSGAGKTTMSRLAPADATVLTDEISYVRRATNREGEKNYVAFGTPFAGELARVGANTSAPLEALYLLVQGPENRIAPISKIDAARAIMRHVLFLRRGKRARRQGFRFRSRICLARSRRPAHFHARRACLGAYPVTTTVPRCPPLLQPTSLAAAPSQRVNSPAK